MILQNIQHLTPLYRLTSAIKRMQQNIASQRKARAAYDKTLSELSAMSPQELNDISIDRADIEKIASQASLMN
jgi:uncharacterized protein YjiS (DUF1127 family)